MVRICSSICMQGRSQISTAQPLALERNPRHWLLRSRSGRRGRSRRSGRGGEAQVADRVRVRGLLVDKIECAGAASLTARALSHISPAPFPALLPLLANPSHACFLSPTRRSQLAPPTSRCGRSPLDPLNQNRRSNRCFRSRGGAPRRAYATPLSHHSTPAPRTQSSRLTASQLSSGSGG